MLVARSPRSKRPSSVRFKIDWTVEAASPSLKRDPVCTPTVFMAETDDPHNGRSVRFGTGADETTGQPARTRLRP